MNRLALPPFLAALSLSADAAGEFCIVDGTVQTRVGYDTNPIGAGGQTAAVLGDSGALTFALRAGIGIARAPETPPSGTFKAAYAAELVRFDGWRTEDFLTHKFSFDGLLPAGEWKLTGDGSALFIAGSRDTLASLSSANAHAITLWRERRRQWQYQLKVQAETDSGPAVVRTTASLLAYDYRTRAVAGKVPFADRSEVKLGAVAGWKQRPRSLFLAGLMGGEEHQGTVPLPDSAFDYSNTYIRVPLGWEGRAPGNTTVSFFAGPDFRHYYGQIDSSIFLHGRDRTSLWLEGRLLAKPTKALTITANVTRMTWLSSTGRSAYLDNSVEMAADLKLSCPWTARMSVKVQQSEYYPVLRNDWEALVGAGVTWTIADKFTISADLLRHIGWNTIDGIDERRFHRTTLSVGASLKL